MPGRAITAVYLHMGKQAQENHIQWLGMGQTKELFLSPAKKFSKEFMRTKTKTKNIR